MEWHSRMSSSVGRSTKATGRGGGGGRSDADGRGVLVAEGG
jgi:hypothetical protein